MSSRPVPAPLAAAHKRRLRARAHALKPVVIVGASGITASLVETLGQALNDHALIKVRVNAETRFARRELIGELCAACDAHLVQTIGHIAVLYREPEDDALKKKFSEILD